MKEIGDREELEISKGILGDLTNDIALARDCIAMLKETGWIASDCKLITEFRENLWRVLSGYGDLLFQVEIVPGNAWRAVDTLISKYAITKKGY